MARTRLRAASHSLRTDLLPFARNDSTMQSSSIDTLDLSKVVAPRVPWIRA